MHPCLVLNCYRAADEAVTTRRIWCRVGFLRIPQEGGKSPQNTPFLGGSRDPPKKVLFFENFPPILNFSI